MSHDERDTIRKGYARLLRDIRRQRTRRPIYNARKAAIGLMRQYWPLDDITEALIRQPKGLN